MKTLTSKENEALLLIFKDYAVEYNANSLSKKLSITPRGALKILKNLRAENLLISKQFGKAVFYKINLEDNYAHAVIESLLIKESRERAGRWIFDFKDMFKYVQIAVIFGSALRNYKEARDIDVLLIFEKGKFKEVMRIIDDKNEISTKPIHPITMTLADLKTNLEKKNAAMMSAVREGCILYGYDKLIEVIKNVTKF
jgi:predicted nucleotidyltransferase